MRNMNFARPDLGQPMAKKIAAGTTSTAKALLDASLPPKIGD